MAFVLLLVVGMLVAGLGCLSDAARDYQIQSSAPPSCAPSLHRQINQPLQVLATADEAAVAKALVPAIAQQMRSRSSSGNQSAGASAASAANYAAVGIAARASATLVQSAREHLRRQMRELAALTADIAEDEEAAAAAQAAAAGAPAGGGAGKGGSGSGAAGTLTDDLSAAELAHIKHQVAQLGGSGLPGEPGKATGPEVTIAPVAHLQWTQGVVRWAWLDCSSSWKRLD